MKLALYYDEIIEAIPQYKYDKVYGSLICSIPPFNILMLPTSIIYFFIKDKDKLARINSFLVKIAFAPKILLITPIFIAGNVLFLPFAYLATMSYLFTINIRIINDFLIFVNSFSQRESKVSYKI